MAHVDFAEHTAEPTCEVCRQLLASARAQVLAEAPDTCRDIERIRTFPGLHRERLPGTHAAAITGVRLRYRIPTFVTCIYGHDHQLGAIVTLLCGFTVLVGHQCARKTVANWEELDDELRRLDTRSQNMKDVRAAPETIDAAKATYLGVEILARAAQSLATDKFFGISGKLPENGEVHAVWSNDYLGRIVGREVFKQQDTFNIRRGVRELADAVAGNAAMDDETVAGIADRVRRLRSRTKNLQNWRANAVTFFYPANLHLVIVAAGLTNRLKVEGGRLIRVDGDTTYSVGADGLRQEPTKPKSK